jgi:sugar/nucleoside kinase (ribokinase family)
VTFDLAVVGTPFLDLTLAGLPDLPTPGREVLADDLFLSPGGAAMIAAAAARLGLSTALVGPVGQDFAAEELRRLLRAEGVTWTGPPAARSSITVLMPTPGGSAMATHLDPSDVTEDDLGRVDARGVVLSLGRLTLRPRGVRCYAVTGAMEVERLAELPGELEGVDAVIMTADEASALTGEPGPEGAARALAVAASTAVVTRGAEGAVAATGRDVVAASGIEVQAVDATGAGDLFTAAYAWADVHGFRLEDRLCWAVLYAGLSVRAPTPLGGAMRVEEFLEEGRRRGLSPPASFTSS